MQSSISTVSPLRQRMVQGFVVKEAQATELVQAIQAVPAASWTQRRISRLDQTLSSAT